MGTERAKKEGVNVNWVQADLLSWQRQEKLDFILDSGCLHSLVGGNVKRYKSQILFVACSRRRLCVGSLGEKTCL
jgi:hypothetical protein